MATLFPQTLHPVDSETLDLAEEACLHLVMLNAKLHFALLQCSCNSIHRKVKQSQSHCHLFDTIC